MIFSESQGKTLPQAQRAFTLVELLAVIAVISLLLALLMPAVQQVRERARSAQCLSQLKQLGIALQSYEATHSLWPPSIVRQEDGKPPPPSIPFAALRYRAHWTGFHMLLPYLDQEPLYRKYQFSGTWLSPLNDANDHSSWPLNQTVLPVLTCPSAPHSVMAIGGENPAGAHWMAGAPGDYSFNHGQDIIRAIAGDEAGCAGGLLHYWSQIPTRTRGPFGYNSNCRVAHVRDGLTHTILIGEKSGGRLIYSGWNSTFPKLSVEYPWAMAAIEFFAQTGGTGVSNSAWVAGPFAATHDFRLPLCPESTPGTGTPFPMNPVPRNMPATSDERPLYSFQSMHFGGTNFLFADGSVKFLNENINQGVYQGLSTIAGIEIFSDGDF